MYNAVLVGAGEPEEDAAIERVMSELRCEFAPELSARIDELCVALEHARAAPAEIANARALAHKLHGTAGSYGFAAVAEIAGALDFALSQGSVDPSAVAEAIGKLRAAKS